VIRRKKKADLPSPKGRWVGEGPIRDKVQKGGKPEGMQSRAGVPLHSLRKKNNKTPASVSPTKRIA